MGNFGRYQYPLEEFKFQSLKVRKSFSPSNSLWLQKSFQKFKADLMGKFEMNFGTFCHCLE